MCFVNGCEGRKFGTREEVEGKKKDFFIPFFPFRILTLVDSASANKSKRSEAAPTAAVVVVVVVRLTDCFTSLHFILLLLSLIPFLFLLLSFIFEY